MSAALPWQDPGLPRPLKPGPRTVQCSTQLGTLRPDTDRHTDTPPTMHSGEMSGLNFVQDWLDRVWKGFIRKTSYYHGFLTDNLGEISGQQLLYGVENVELV